jgi:hypothetical protein
VTEEILDAERFLSSLRDLDCFVEHYPALKRWAIFKGGTGNGERSRLGTLA